MNLILILGPMKSGKSRDLVRHFSALRDAGISFALYQHLDNVRDEHIQSRDGDWLPGAKVADLSVAMDSDAAAIGVDEIHFFNEENAEIIAELLSRGKQVVLSGLPIDYRGEMFPIVRRLIEMGPKEIRMKRAVCEICESLDAAHTQIFNENGPITGGLLPSVPDDGTYIYKAVCANCFVSPAKTFKNLPSSAW